MMDSAANEPFLDARISETYNNECICANNSQEEYDNEFNLRGITLNISQVCNMNCSYCFANEGSYNNKGLMSFDIAKKSVDILKIYSSNERCHITFFGGEPLINFNLIKKIVNYSLNIFSEGLIDFSILTNGTILDEKIIDFIKNHPIRIQISVDGNPHFHNIHRKFKDGSPTFDKILENIIKLKNAGIDPIIRATLCHNNTYIKDFSNYFINDLDLMIGIVPVRSDDENIRFTEDDLDNLYKNYLEIYEDITKKGDIKQIIFNEFINSMICRYLDRESLLDHSRNCTAGKNMVAVDINGEIYPCHSFIGLKEFNTGNVYDIDFIGLKNFVERVRRSNKDICVGCKAKIACNGACYHDNYIKSGEIAIINEDYCAFKRNMFEIAVMTYDYMRTNCLSEELARNPRLINLYKLLSDR